MSTSHLNRTHSGVASLSGLALTSVPEQAIANLPTGTRLRALDLSNNALTALPATLPELPSLTRLSLASNRITADGECRCEVAVVGVTVIGGSLWGC